MADVTYNSLQYMTRSGHARDGGLPEGPRARQFGADKPRLRYASRRKAACCCSLGKPIYDEQCASCHGDEGLGKPPHYPPLAGNQSIQMSSAVNPIRMVLNGGYPPGTAGNPMPHGMPPFAQSLSDDEIAAVVTYIRTSWGNRGAAVSARRGQRASLRTAATEDAMIVSQDAPPSPETEDARIDEIVRSGPRGAVVVAGIATAIVIALWFAFYFMVFLPRGSVQ